MVLLFEFGWLIYGNTFHYSEKGIACMKMSSGAKTLWILMMIILAIGYVTFLFYSFIVGLIINVQIASIRKKRQITQEINDAMHPVDDRLPSANIAQIIRSESFP